MAGLKMKLCKFFNIGLRKFKQDCRFFTQKKYVLWENVFLKTCIKRHPRKCRYRERCRMGPNCMYNHIMYNMKTVENEINENIKIVKDKLQSRSTEEK